MENKNSNKITYTKQMLMKKISEMCDFDLNFVKEVYYALEDSIAEILSTTTEKNNVSIRLFEGITIDGVYVPQSIRINNLTGKIITSIAKIKPKVHVTKSYSQKITNMA